VPYFLLKSNQVPELLINADSQDFSSIFSPAGILSTALNKTIETLGQCSQYALQEVMPPRKRTKHNISRSAKLLYASLRYGCGNQMGHVQTNN